ncbi:MAG: oligosaccharide repeat unit polymerase [Flavobacteriales bacterium]|nr:oligosaccharide repeat unit polymerase [Flavobacteriales bacterium]MCB9447417.1 oligosaccharide repeat unit polymerase [Flavobacteriales bacterium]
MLRILIIIAFVVEYLAARTFNPDCINPLIALWSIYFVSVWIQQKTFRKNFVFSPVFVFNSIYYLIFSVTDISGLFYDHELSWVIVYAFLSFNVGVPLAVFLNRDIPQQMNIRFIPKAYNNYITISLGMGVISMIVYFLFFGIPLLQANINEARTVGNTGAVNPLFFVIKYNANIALLMLCIASIKRYVLKQSFHIRGFNFLLGGVLLFLMVLESNRTSFYYVFVPSFVYLLVLKRRISIKSVVIPVVFILSIAYFGRYRNAGSFDRPITVTFLNELVAMKYNLTTVYRYYSEHEEREHGMMHLRGLAVLLPGHQLDMSLFLKNKLGIEFEGGGMTPTILGQIYVDFGFWGLIIEMFLLGLLLNQYFFWVLHSHREIVLIMFCYLMAYFPYSIRNGILYSYAIVFSLVFIWLYKVVLRKSE